METPNPKRINAKEWPFFLCRIVEVTI